MDPGQPEHKRPRLETNPSSSSWRSTALAHPAPSQQPQQPQPPPPHHHPLSGPGPGPYHRSPFAPRSAEAPLPHPLQPPPQHLQAQQHPAQQHPAPPPPPPPPPPAAYANERRHHEYDHYPPMPDQSRQPPSPATRQPDSHYPYQPRDPGVKREMYDDSYPRRPHSTGAAPPDSLPAPQPPPLPTHPTPNASHHPPPPHPHPHPGQPYQDDSRRHMSFDNGQSMPATPVAYRNTFPPPPQPMSQTPYEQTTPYQSAAPLPPPGADPSYNHVAYASSSQKRKATRASQACDYCRQLKAKCDEMKPCKTCKEKNQECKYRDPLPKATDKSQADILEGIADLKSSMEENFLKFHERISSLEQHGIGRLAGPYPKKDVKMEIDNMAPGPLQSPTPATEGPYDETDRVDAQFTSHPQPQQGTPQLAFSSADDSHRGDEDGQLRRVMADERGDDFYEPPGPAVRPGLPSIPVNHTVSAGLLLMWPSIKALTADILPRVGIQYAEDFPQYVEERRGVLKLFGKGEGHGRPEALAPDVGSELDAESISEPASSPAAQADWGQLGGLSPNVDYKSSTLTVYGQPDFSPEVVDRYIQSFKENTLNLHPILLHRHLEAWVKNFLEHASPKTRQPNKPGPLSVARFPVPSAETIGKRKRSPSEPSDHPGSPGAQPGTLRRHPDDALVLVALALGKLSLHKGKIPEVAPRDTWPSYQSPVVRNGHPASPVQTSPPSQSSGLTSPQDQNPLSASRRSSWQQQQQSQSQQQQGPTSRPPAPQSMKRNYDSIPGLEYLALATDILGNNNGAPRLRQIQTNILVALYYGQIGSVVQSQKYILDASWALQIEMRRDFPRLQRMRANAETPTQMRDQLLLLAFWSCLQMESDIVVELDLPRSGILSYEEIVPHPNLRLLDCDGSISASYLAQLYVRKQLNFITNKFYSQFKIDPDAVDHEGGPVSLEEVRQLLAMDPQARLSWLPEAYRFTEDDEPATDMLSARLRAKYWGFQVVCLRPFVKMMLDFSCGQPSGSDMAFHPETRFNSKVHAPYIEAGTKSYEDVSPDIKRYAQLGIRALINSTTPFYNLGNDRLVLPNFFGTAMAQWGNLNVLSACYKDPFLSQFVDQFTLHALFDKTIHWISLGAQPSSSLAYATRMLAALRDKLFPPEASSTQSFSSTHSGGGGHVSARQSPVQPMQTVPPTAAAGQPSAYVLQQPPPAPM